MTKTSKHIRYTKIVWVVKKKQSKKLYFQNKLKPYENNIKKACNVVKAAIKKFEICNDKIPKELRYQ